MSTVNNLGNVVMLGTNPLSTEDPEIKTANGQKIKINGVELDPTGGGGGGGSVAKATEFKLENPMTDADTRAVLFQQTENATDLKISTKAGTGNGVITFESGGQTDNKFQVNNLGALCTGNLATKGKIQLADGTTDINLNEVSQFTQGGPNLTISTQQAGDINLATEATGGHININPNGTNSVKVENNAVRLNAETFVNNNLRLGTAGTEATIFQNSGSRQLTMQTLAGPNINDCAINLESSGLVNVTANGTDGFVKLAVGNTTKLLAYGGEVMLGPEGTNINRMIGGTKITEANTLEAKQEEAELKMTVGGLRNDLEINTAGTGTSKGHLVVNTEIEPNDNFRNINVETPITGGDAINIYTEHLALFRDALKFNQSWHFNTSINQAAQGNDASSGILFNGTNSLFTQYYNGYKTKTSTGGDVQAPLLQLQNTGGFLTMEFYNSNSDTDPGTPPLKSTLNTQLQFPASSSSGITTNGYLGLKIDQPFVIPLFNTITGTVGGTTQYLDSQVNHVWNNRVGNWTTQPQVIYRPLTSAAGQFEFFLDMPNLTGVPTTVTNFAYVYITYQPTHDLRQLN